MLYIPATNKTDLIITGIIIAMEVLVYTINICPIEGGHYLAQPKEDKRLEYKTFKKMLFTVLTTKSHYLTNVGGQHVYCIEAPKEEIQESILDFAKANDLHIEVV